MRDIHSNKIHKSTSGFTLIELLIVIVIISIVSSVAVLNLGVNKNKQLETFTNQFTNTLKLAEQEAMLRPATLRLVINKNSYQFYEYRPQANPDASPWHTLTDSTLGLHHIPKDFQMTVKIAGQHDNDEEQQQPPLIFSTSGDLTPFTIYVGRKDASPRFKIIGSGNGNIRNEMIDEEK